jgi:CRISPR-associated endonuclease/helicase Cas3
LPILAKSEPDEALDKHLLKTLEIAEYLSNSVLTKRERVDEQLCLSIRLASAFHDIGKSDSRWQQLVRRETSHVVPHPLLGLPILEELTKKRLREPYRSLTTLAVASHHTRLHPALYEDKSIKIEIDENSLSEFNGIVQSVAKKAGIQSSPFTSTSLDSLENAEQYLFDCMENAVSWNIDSPKKSLDKREYFVTISGILQQADWYSSSGREPFKLRFPRSFLVGDGRPNKYQLRSARSKGNLYVTMPTGTGKTEIALYWAKANSLPSNRVFYILPTMTTINTMYERIRSIWKQDNLKRDVGFYHSSADLYLDSAGDTEAENDLPFYKYYFYPVNVTTPDQLILAHLNYRRYSLRSLSLKNSIIVMDEIHSYDPECFALIKGLLQILKERYNAKVCVMSATFPKPLRKELQFLKGKDLLTSKEKRNEYASRKRTSLELDDQTILQRLPSIIEQIQETKKHTLIVANTVDVAQQIYLKIKEQLNLGEDELLLMHSRYTFDDRRKREKRLFTSPPRILVSTQVVEVSLNIDYDVLHTEACYPDSLVQRAGRVNRFPRPERAIAKVLVYTPSTHYPYEETFLQEGFKILEEYSGKISSELDYITMTDDFYARIWDAMCSETEDRYQEVWNATSYIYSADLSDEETQQLLRTRSGLISIPAYPDTEDFRSVISELNRNVKETTDGMMRRKCLKQKRKLLVDVPYTFRTKNLFQSDGKDRFIRMNYDSELGLSTAYTPMS